MTSLPGTGTGTPAPAAGAPGSGDAAVETGEAGTGGDERQPCARRLSNRYALTGRIAAGGMGEVWHGVDELLGRPVAVKLLSQKYAADEQFRARFRAEARYAASLSHAGIARVFDYGEADQEPPAAAGQPAAGATSGHTLPGPSGGGHRTGVAYLVMELIDGEPLSAILARDGRRPAAETLDLIEQAASALQAAHAAGIVHRDVKPGNMLITPDGQVKLTDFGIARAVLAAPVTQTGMVVGTARYVSPEQASGASVTAASDIYSLGVVGYECVAGQPPFTAETPLALALAHVSRQPPPLPGGVPQPVAALIGQMLAKDPAKRPASAQAVAERARALRNSLPAADSPAAGERGAAPAPLAPVPTLADMPVAGDFTTPAAWFSHSSTTDPAPSLTGTARTNRTSGQRGRGRRSVLSALIVVAVLMLLTAGAIALISDNKNPAATAGPKHPTGRAATHRTGRSRHPAHLLPAAPAPATASRRPASARPTTPEPSGSPTGSPSPSPSPDPTGTPTGSPPPTSTPTPTGTGTSSSPMTQSPRQPGSTTLQDG